jgi:hypothetical protein
LRITFDEGWVGVDLTEYFRRSDCVVEHAGARGLEVKPRQALLPDAAKLEIEGLLRVWCKLHPEASIATWGPEQAPIARGGCAFAGAPSAGRSGAPRRRRAV